MSQALALPNIGGSAAGSGGPSAARGKRGTTGSVGLVADLSQKLARQRKQCVAPTTPASFA
eukprot:COSAG02_NODE_232_length_27935_cov_16.544511_5_plen_61_part_00